MLRPACLRVQALSRPNYYQFKHHITRKPRIWARMTTISAPSAFSPFEKPPRDPLIVIIGATGTGKSNLAIQLAHYLSCNHHGHREAGAEILNADAMQLYRGLPIITNKLSFAEQEGVPHHLLGHIGLEEEPWTVQRFVKEADRVIGQIRERNNIPIVVGGTGYYVHGLLVKDAVLESQERQIDGDEGGDKTEGEFDEMGYGKDTAETWPILNASTEEIYAKLQDVDPVMARRWHPKDRRKIQRSLEIYLRTGKKASHVYEEQQEGYGDLNERPKSSGSEFEDQPNTMTGKMSLRYDPIIFWLDAQDKVLKPRLDKRVDSMVTNGLLDEARQMSDFENEMTKGEVSVDKSKGIWVSIGYKEMEPWVKALQNEGMHENELSKLEISCIDAVKAGTRRYAKRQNRYIRIRFANILSRVDARNRLFLLDCTDLEKWVASVQGPAQSIVNDFIQGGKLPEAQSLSELARETFANMDGEGVSEERIQRRCDTCDKILMTGKEWTGHINSRSHKRVLEGIRKRELHESRKKTAALTADVRLD